MKVNFYKQTETRIPRKALSVAASICIREVVAGAWGPKKPEWARGLAGSRVGMLGLNLVFVCSRESARMNGEFRSKLKPTDVLSFAPSEEGLIGELVLCPSVISEQAPRFSHTYEMELVYMVIHGILHLCGWDHERSAAEEKRMFALQDRIFAKVMRKLGK